MKDNEIIHTELLSCFQCGENSAIVVIRRYMGFIKIKYWCDRCKFEDTVEY